MKVYIDSDSDSETLPLVLSKTRKIKLTDQSAVIQEILHLGIAMVTESVIFVQNWPEENCRTQYGTAVLLEVCSNEVLAKYGHELLEVKKLLKYHAKFAKAMSDVVSCTLFPSLVSLRM